MTSRAETEYRYEKLTWPEINDAVELGKVCIVPCGAVEQHGPHLPLDVDLMCPRRHRQWRRPRNPGQNSGTAGARLRLHRARDGFSRHDQHALRDLHPAGARRDEVARLSRLQANHPVERPRLEHAQPRPGGPADEPRDRRRLRGRRLVESADCRQGVPAELAREQIPRRLLARLRAGDLAVSLPRRGKRPQRQDQERHDLDQRRGEPVQLGRPVRLGPSDRRSRGPAAIRKRACWATRKRPRRKKASGPTTKPSNSSSALSSTFCNVRETNGTANNA